MSLKAENNLYVIPFVILNSIFLYLFVIESAPINNLIETLNYEWEKKSLIGVVSGIFAIALNALVDRDNKTRLVYFKWNESQPACRAFSLYGPNDSRVDMKVLENNHGNFPESGSEQNQSWYKILKKHEGKDSVKWAHKNWLLMRDLSTLAALFMIFSFFSHLLNFNDMSVISTHMIIIVLEFLLCVAAARTNGISFVTTVLAEESASLAYS